MAMLVFSLRSDLTPVTVATVAAAAVLGLGHLLFSRARGDRPGRPGGGAGARGRGRHRAGRPCPPDPADPGGGTGQARGGAREQDARQRIRERVHEERLRIARDLHDAVGHQVALISVQAGAMGYLLGTDLEHRPGQGAGVARAHPAGQRGRARGTQADRGAAARSRATASPPSRPAGLGRLEELIGSFAATGLKVTCEVTGQARPLPEAVDLTAYRRDPGVADQYREARGRGVRRRSGSRTGPGCSALAVEDDGPGASGNASSATAPRATASSACANGPRRWAGGYRRARAAAAASRSSPSCRSRPATAS